MFLNDVGASMLKHYLLFLVVASSDYPEAFPGFAVLFQWLPFITASHH
jgi:hypothetical protein